MFCWFPAAILVDQNGTPIWCLHTKLYKGARNVSANNSETVGRKDLRLAQIVYILVYYNISFSCFLPRDGFQFNFCCVAVKTIYITTRNAWIFIALPEQSKLLKEYNEDFFKTWHLKNAESTVMNPAANKYVKYKNNVSRQRSTLLAIAICYHVSCFGLGLPISSLVLVLLRRINRTTFGLKKTSEIDEADLEKFVDSHFSPEEREEAQVILRDGMINELNFFWDACNESLVHCPSVIFHYVNQSCLLVFFYELKEFCCTIICEVLTVHYSIIY